MNRRGLLALGGVLLVGEPARRAYSFLTANPLAYDHAAIRARLIAYVQSELLRYTRDPLGRPLPPPPEVAAIAIAYEANRINVSAQIAVDPPLLSILIEGPTMLVVP